MTLENKIIQELKVINSFSFEMMVNDLIGQGAFPEIVSDNASVEPFGVNIEKRRNIISGRRSDAELASQGIALEYSVQEDWRSKLRCEVKRNTQKGIKTFAFFSNQDVGTKEIHADMKRIDAEKYYCDILNCEKCFIRGQKDLVVKLQNPSYFSIRRNYLDIPHDFFCSIHVYKSILRDNNSLACEVDKSKIEEYGTNLANDLSFDPKQILLVHNDDYVTLLHTIEAWGSRSATGNNSPNSIDLCFIRWPCSTANLENVSDMEIDDDIRTFIFIWGAHQITNLSDYLRFNRRNATLVFVCKSAFKDMVAERLHGSGANISLRELHILDIDGRQITPNERKMHEQKIAAIVANLASLLLKYEALIYFYSPFRSDDLATNRRIRNILEITKTQARQLDNLLLKNDLAAITGRILWLKQPFVAKGLLSDYVDQNIFSIDELME